MKLPREVARKVLELAGESPQLRPPGEVGHRMAGPVPVRVVVGPIPVALRSEANAGGRLRNAIKRKQQVKEAVRSALATVSPPPLPVVVVLTRLGVKEQDGDNNQRTLKSCRDEVSRWLGVDDGDKLVRWRYAQSPGWTSGVVIDVRTRSC
jgi:hypothetical protein